MTDTAAAKSILEGFDPAVFASDVRSSLERTPRQLPSKYFYDELGSSLFEVICRLPWYRITRAESSLLAHNFREILRPLNRPLTLVELGCGSGEKLAILAGGVDQQVPQVQLIDISAMALEIAQRRLQAVGLREVIKHHATYEDGLERAVCNRSPESALAVLFLGSNIGNFEPAVAQTLLVRIKRLLSSGDALVLGTDLVKPERELLLAYDDPLQVTAAFNRNLLQRINSELDGTFDLDGFVHRAVWCRNKRRMEMHLVSKTKQTVHIGAAGFQIAFEEGESIWTESSYKYVPEQVLAFGRAAGFGPAEQWIDHDAGFVVTRFVVT